MPIKGYKKLKASSEDEDESVYERFPSENGKKFQMARTINTFTGVSLVAGSIIGSGIFIIPSNILNYCNGNVILSLCIWVLSGIVAMLVAFCHCELATLIPESGGASMYLRKAFGDCISFIYLWLVMMTIHAEALALTSIAFGDYVSKSLSQMLFSCNIDFPPSLSKYIGVSLLLLMVYINMCHLKLALKFQVFCTFGKVLALLLVAFFGFMQLFKDSTLFMQNLHHNNSAYSTADEHTSTEQESNVHSLSLVSAVSLAVFEGLWAYDGFDTITLITEEVKNPQKALPRIIIYSVVFVMCLYMFVFISYLSVLSVDEIRTTTAIAVDYSMKINPWLSHIITASVCLSLMGSINNTYLSAGRLPFVAARAGFMPKIFSMVHIHYLTPVPGMLMMVTTSLLLMFPSDLNSLLDAVLFCAWIFKGLCCLGLLVLRRKMPHARRAYKVYTLTAVLAFLSVMYLVCFSLFAEPQFLYFITIVFSFAFYVLYVLMRKGHIDFTNTGPKVIFLQKLMCCAATDYHEM